jgi:hypothetical protein
MNLDVVASDVVRFRNRKLAWARDKSDLIAWQFRVNVRTHVEYHEGPRSMAHWLHVWCGVWGVV